MQFVVCRYRIALFSVFLWRYHPPVLRFLTCECGLTYVVGSPEDEDLHARIHAEYLRGPVIPVLKYLSRSETFGPLAVYFIDSTLPLPVRQNFRDVAVVWARAIPGPAGYDGTVDEHDQRVLVAAEGDRVVGAAVTAFDDYAWPLRWTPEGSIEMRDEKALTHRRCKVARVWTAGAYRRRGLALHLVQLASRLLSCGVGEMGWELPFTRSGEGLVKRLCPDAFWRGGDRYTLARGLDPKSQG